MDLLDWITGALTVIAVVAALKYPINGRNTSDENEKSSDQPGSHDQQ